MVRSPAAYHTTSTTTGRGSSSNANEANPKEDLSSIQRWISAGGDPIYRSRDLVAALARWPPAPSLIAAMRSTSSRSIFRVDFPILHAEFH